MRIVYLMDRPEPGGGAKVIFQHAALLGARGHEILLAGFGPRPDHTAPAGAPAPVYVDFGRLPVDGVPELPWRPDLVLATYWTTIPLARRVDAGAAGHFCQGFEPDWPHMKERREEIESVYEAARLPTLVVTPHLGRRLAERLEIPWRLAPPPLDTRFRTRRRSLLPRRPRRDPWIAIPGIYEAEIKGVKVALEAVRRLREEGRRCRVLRISLLEPPAEERELLLADRYLVSVPPDRVAEELRDCDLLLFPALPGEGFGLPLLEALASGVPAVASRLPPTEFVGGDAVPLVDPGRPGELAREAARILGSPREWRDVRRRGLRAAERFAAPRIAHELEEAMAWAAGEPEALATRGDS